MHIIYWYSGSGNSLYIAEKIGMYLADKGINVELIKICRPFDQVKLPSIDDYVGLVVPVHGYRLPKTVHSFLTEYKLNGKYNYLITTAGGDSYNVHQDATKSGYFHQYYHNFIMPDNAIYLYEPNSSQGETFYLPLIQNLTPEIETVSQGVMDRQSNSVKNVIFGSLMTNVAGGLFKHSIKNIGKHFTVDESCIRCGQCVKLCPENNIKLTDHIEYENNCAACMACIEWCPKKAINYKDKTQSRSRYHNPFVRYNEMVSLKITFKDDRINKENELR